MCLFHIVDATAADKEWKLKQAPKKTYHKRRYFEKPDGSEAVWANGLEWKQLENGDIQAVNQKRISPILRCARFPDRLLEVKNKLLRN